jgi:hypothetical protein
MSGNPVERPVDVLERWEAAGSGWRVIGRSTAGVTVALMTCDGGEEVSRFTSDDADLLAFVGGRTGSDG